MGVKKWLLGRPETIQRNSYIWNSIAGFANALQSTFILFVLQRVANESVSGVFTITFATANLMLTIGKYGIRYYQVSDVKGQFSKSDYYSHRMFTNGLMLMASVLFCIYSLVWGGYDPEKTAVCMLLCLQKMGDSFEDVIHGEYHRSGRLDVCGRAVILRLFPTILSFIVGFVITENLVVASFVAMVINFAMVWGIANLLNDVLEKPKANKNFAAVKKLTMDCFPLFLSGFLSMFIVNAPKYAIDANLSEELQATYGFISMPVFLVALLAEFLFRPMTTAFSQEWVEGKYAAFVKRIFLIVAAIVALTVICILGGVIVGLPVLSFLFNTQLKPYWAPFSILLVGGGLLSLTSFLTLVLTIMRKQHSVIWAYVVASVVALPIANYLVRSLGLLGASVSYLTVIAILCACVIGFVVYFVHSGRKGVGKCEN